MNKKLAIGILAIVVVIMAYAAYNYSSVVQSQRAAEAKAAEAQQDREKKNAFSDYLDNHIPADAYKLLANINGHSVLVNNGEATVNFRVLFDFEIPYVADMVIPVIQDATEATGVPLATLSIQCYAESNQNGIEDGSMISWRTHDLVSGTFASGHDDYLMPSATVEDMKAYFTDEATAVDQLLGRDVSGGITTSNSDGGNLERFGSLLEVFQGEWKQLESDWHLIIDGDQICAAYYQNYGDDVTEPMHSYHFDFDDNGELIVKQYSTPKYIYTIRDDGHLYSQSVSSPITNEYAKVSGNTAFPS